MASFGAVRLSYSAPATRGWPVNWLRYAYQRADAPEDACDLATMNANLGQPGYSIKDMIGDLTQNKSFMNRPIEVTP